MDRKQYAQALRDNPVWSDILEDLQADIVNRFATTPPDELPGLQLEYKLAERLATMFVNSVHREAE